MNDPNADLLFSVLALQNKFVSRGQLIEALNLWAIDKRRSLAEMIAQKGAITPEDQQLLKRLVERQLEVHGEVEASLCESQGAIDLAEHCSQIDDFELREQLQSFASRALSSQLAMTRLSGDVSPSRLNSSQKESGHKEIETNEAGSNKASISGLNRRNEPARNEPARKESARKESFRTDQPTNRSLQSSVNHNDATIDTQADSPHTPHRQTDLTNAGSNPQSITSVRPASRSHSSASNQSNPSESELDATAASRPLTKESHGRPKEPGSSHLPEGYPSAGRFSIVNSHAKGGLGEVFLARDNELDREVALKEIQRKFASNEEARVRFEFEACITGGLEHPGVVPVYAYGKYSDGRLFYAMRFIRGRSMKEEVADYHQKIAAAASADELRSALRGLLTRFVDTCQAIAYAHSRGVVHRDLKPANVMLGKFGETLVVDWGLAKSVGRDEYHASPDEVTLLPMSGSSSSGTMQGSTLGTPGYMSPEQAAGRLHEMGPASDIFSLGATLYNILVGTAPFEGKKASEIVANAAENRFVEPLKRLPQIARPLNAIVMKAMATRPGDRYHTAMELAADVEAYLADDLVAAYQEKLWERSQRWIRQHRTLATAVFVLISTLGLAAGLGAVLLNSEKNRTQMALKQESEALAALTVEQEKTQRALAALTFEQEKTQRALTAETLARRQTREMLNTISDDLVGELMGQQVVLTDANQRFFDRVLQQFEQFTTSMDSSAEAQNLRADGYFRVANLQRRLTRLDEAQSAYTQSIEAWKKLAAEHPHNLNYQQDLAAAQANLGLVHAARSNFPAALEQYTLAAKQFSDLLAVAKSDSPRESEEPKEPKDGTFVSTAASSLDSTAINKIELELARLNGNLANTLVNLNRRGEAEPYYKRALERFSNLKSSSYTAAASDQARILGNYAAFASREKGRMPEARKLMEEAVETLSSTGVDADGNLPPRLRLDRSQYQKNLGKILLALGEKELAIEKSKATVSELTNLADEFPAVSDYRRELAVNQVELANLLRADQPEQANAQFDMAIKSFERIIADNPTQTRTRRELAASLDNWGYGLAEAKFGLAKDYFERARKLRLELHQAEPDNPTLRDEWFAGENNLANQYRNREDYQAAIPIYKQLLLSLEQSAKPEDDPLFSTKLRYARFGFADSLSRSDQYAVALPIWNQLVEIRADEDWAIFEFQRAICLIRTGDIEGGLAAGKQLVDVEKPEPIWLFDMACCYAIACEMSAGPNKRKTDSDKAALAQQEAWALAAIKYLNLAGEAGFYDEPGMRDHASGDNDLKSLKDRPDFETFRQKYLTAGGESH